MYFVVTDVSRFWGVWNRTILFSSEQKHHCSERLLSDVTDTTKLPRLFVVAYRWRFGDSEPVFCLPTLMFCIVLPVPSQKPYIL